MIHGEIRISYRIPGKDGIEFDVYSMRPGRSPPGTEDDVVNVTGSQCAAHEFNLGDSH